MPAKKQRKANKSAAQSNQPAVTAERSVIACAAGLLVFCVFLGGAGVAALVHFRYDLYREAGGEIVSGVSEEGTFRQTLNNLYRDRPQKEINRIKGRKIGSTLLLSKTDLSYWLCQVFWNGWVPYAIILGFLTGFFYALLARLFGLIPSWHLSGARRRFKRVAHQITNLRATRVSDIQEVLTRIDGKDRLAARLRKLQQHFEREKDRQLCREANQAYSQSDQAEVMYVLLPLGFIEFLLPILGFIGTVLGVSEAVGALRWGMNNLFKAGELNEAVMNQFMAGFDGLVLAFMTTLFGLLGLALTASFRFYLRRNATAVIAKVDNWSEEVINLLPQENHLEDIAQAILQTDSNGSPVRDSDGRVVPRLAEMLVMTDQNGVPLRDAQGELVPNSTELLAETDEQGMPVRGKDGRLRPRLGEVLQLLRTGLFERNEDNPDQPIPQLDGVRRMIELSTAATQRIHNALMNYIYQIVGYDDKDDYTTLTVYITDPETGETESMDVQGRLRTERQQAELLTMMRMLAEELAGRIDGTTGKEKQEEDDKQGDTFERKGPGPGRLVIQATESPVRDVSANKAGFAVVRSDDPETGDAELIAGHYENVMGEMRPKEADKSRLPMAIAALGFCSSSGSDADRFAAYLPFASTSPWKLYGTKTLLPDEPLALCNPTFLREHELLSGKVATLAGKERNWLLFLARKSGHKETALFRLAADGRKRDAAVVEKGMKGDVSAEALHPGKAYAFALRNGKKSEVVLVSGGQSGPAVQHVSTGSDAPSALAFDPKGVLHYAKTTGEVGRIDARAGELKPEFSLDNPSELTGLAFAGSGTVYVSTRASSDLILVRPSSNGKGKPEMRAIAYPRLITALTSTPGGEYIFVGCADGSVYAKNG